MRKIKQIYLYMNFWALSLLIVLSKVNHILLNRIVEQCFQSATLSVPALPLSQRCSISGSLCWSFTNVNKVRTIRLFSRSGLHWHLSISQQWWTNFCSPMHSSVAIFVLYGNRVHHLLWRCSIDRSENCSIMHKHWSI